MRRLLAIVAAAVAAAPLAVGAQTVPTGSIYFDGVVGPATINSAQCSGAQSNDTLDLTWTITPVNGAVFASDGTYLVYASNQDPGTTSPFCYTDNNGAVLAGPVTTTPTVPDATFAYGSATVTASDLAVTAGYDCSKNVTVNVCVLWYPATTTSPGGYAKGTVKLTVTAPGQPTVDTVRPGNEALNLTATTPDGSSGTAAVPAATWRAKAVSVVDGSTHYSSKVAVGTDARITGLINFEGYYVTAFSYSADGNESLESDRYGKTADLPDGLAVQPVPAADLGDVYRASGGREPGGCESGGAGLTALFGAAALLRVRRRS